MAKYSWTKGEPTKIQNEFKISYLVKLSGMLAEGARLYVHVLNILTLAKSWDSSCTHKQPPFLWACQQCSELIMPVNTATCGS